MLPGSAELHCIMLRHVCVCVLCVRCVSLHFLHLLTNKFESLSEKSIAILLPVRYTCVNLDCFISVKAQNLLPWCLILQCFNCDSYSTKPISVRDYQIWVMSQYHVLHLINPVHQSAVRGALLRMCL